jgi:CheY-like chemotaxis protein
MGASGSGSASGGATATGATATTIPQPAVPAHIPVAPESERVDLTMPTFSDPTNLTNPLFPVSLQESVLMLGHVEGKPFRTEVTLLPETRIIEWEGQRVETLVSQYNAFLDERIEEVAYDYCAQADDGSVWYFGEDVFDFRAGAIVVTEGTWLAGRGGPAAMIMPADPHVGDVYRTENAPGFVFEEVTVRSTDETLDGPLGPIRGGMLADELHSDGKTEQKGLRSRLRRVLHGRRRGRGGPRAEGLEMSKSSDLDLIVLDLVLPTVTGEQILTTLRAAGSSVPVIVFTSSDAVPDPVAILNAGFDDYVTRPCSFSELLARIRARLRAADQTVSTTISHGRVTVDVATRDVRIGGRSVDLTPREFTSRR